MCTNLEKTAMLLLISISKSKCINTIYRKAAVFDTAASSLIIKENKFCI